MIAEPARGGHRLVLDGAPSPDTETLPPPVRIRLRRRHRFVPFSEAAVAEGDRVTVGQVLATGPFELAFPLVAPVAGRVGTITDDTIVLDVGDPSGWTARAYTPLAWEAAAPQEIGHRIRDAGLWPALYAAPDGEIPWRTADDDRTPAFVVIGAARGEPHLAHPAVVLAGREAALVEAAAILQRVSRAPRVVLACSPDVEPPAAPGIEVLRVPARAPYDQVLVQCDMVDRGAYAWGIDVQDALAVRDAVTEGRVPGDRLIALAGGLVHAPKHVRVKVGTSVREVTKGRLGGGTPRFLDGGVLSGDAIDPDRDGIAAWGRAITVLPIPQEREFLSFLRPGGDRDSFLGSFLSSVWPDRPRAGHAGMRGERRACVNCTACQWVCPVELLPSILWKFTAHDLVEEAAALGLGRCVECGLCTYVCPAKIELSYAFRRGHDALRGAAAEERAAHAEATA